MTDWYDWFSNTFFTNHIICCNENSIDWHLAHLTKRCLKRWFVAQGHGNCNQKNVYAASFPQLSLIQFLSAWIIHNIYCLIEICVSKILIILTCIGSIHMKISICLLAYFDRLLMHVCRCFIKKNIDLLIEPLKFTSIMFSINLSRRWHR